MILSVLATKTAIYNNDAGYRPACPMMYVQLSLTSTRVQGSPKMTGSRQDAPEGCPAVPTMPSYPQIIDCCQQVAKGKRWRTS